MEPGAKPHAVAHAICVGIRGSTLDLQYRRPEQSVRVALLRYLYNATAQLLLKRPEGANGVTLSVGLLCGSPWNKALTWKRLGKPISRMGRHC